MSVKYSLNMEGMRRAFRYVTVRNNLNTDPKLIVGIIDDYSLFESSNSECRSRI